LECLKFPQGFAPPPYRCGQEGTMEAFAKKSRAFYIIIIKRLLKNVLFKRELFPNSLFNPTSGIKSFNPRHFGNQSIFLIVLQFIMLNSSAVFTGNCEK
jgi:hypothetical protein